MLKDIVFQHKKEKEFLLSKSYISWDMEGQEKFKDKTIQFVPLWKWLLEKPGHIATSTE
jgi:predicted AAA+ superfamily ATPase